MDQSTKNEVLRKIDQLEKHDKRKVDQFVDMTEPVEEALLKEILEPLFAEDGYTTSLFDGADHGPSMIAERPATDDEKETSVGIVQRHYDSDRAIEAHIVQGSYIAKTDFQLDRVLIVSNTRFSQAALDVARRADPGVLELLDIPGLRTWVGRVEAKTDVKQLKLVTQIVKAANHRIAQLIVNNSCTLEDLEWRDLERLVADMFDGMGFDVELTPGSKDGGKDVILKCDLNGDKHSYIVEVKHWRSGQRVGRDDVKDFLNVIVSENRNGGVFLSTYGFTNNAFESLTEIQRKTLRFGDKSKIVGLCQNYLRIQSGLWSPRKNFEDLIYQDTL